MCLHSFFEVMQIDGDVMTTSEAHSRGLQCHLRAVAEKKLFISAALRAAAPPRLSCSPVPHALCNPPACYDREVNKTLGHHKSAANDMSGAEIRRRGALELAPPAAPPRSQCVRSLLKLQLN